MLAKGLELNIALGSPRGLDLQNSSTLILHYLWVCGGHSTVMGACPAQFLGAKSPFLYLQSSQICGVRAGIWQHEHSLLGAVGVERKFSCAHFLTRHYL